MVHALMLRTQKGHSNYVNPIMTSAFKTRDISKKAMNKVGGFAPEAQRRCMVRSGQRRKLHYPTVHRLTDWYSKIKTEPQESSRCTGGHGSLANLSSPIPVPRRPRASPTGRGWGGPEGGERPPSHHGCFILRTIPHHPGFGKCSWSLLVGCKGKKKPS